ncbi:MAG: hypothetical protein KBE09_00925 [Candidatus Pacebacteria bacterium]|nr:hypothetical protein [Candidatus Paceibacterota bacterium]
MSFGERSPAPRKGGIEQLATAQTLAANVFRNHTVEPTDPAHAAYVKEMQARDGTEEGTAMKTSILFEATLIDCIANEGWLGPNVRVTRSPWDDLKHGVDATVSILDESGHVLIALSIDLTTNRDALADKLARIKFNLDEQKLATVDYPGIPDVGTDYKSGIPHCVISASQSRVEQLINAWTAKKMGTNGSALDNSILKTTVALEIEMQLRKFLEYARTKDYRIAIPKLEAALRAITKIVAAFDQDKVKDAREAPATWDYMFGELDGYLSGFNSLVAKKPAGKTDIRGGTVIGDRAEFKVTDGTVEQRGRGGATRSVVVETKKKRPPFSRPQGGN